MKLRSCSALVLITWYIAGCSTPPGASAAKVSQKEAEAVAMAEVQGGTVQSAELEREKGHLVWSFDISIPGSKDIREVLVDAETAEIVAVETETPGEEEAEETRDAKTHGH